MSAGCIFPSTLPRVDDDLIIKISDIAFASDLYRSEYVYDRSRDIYRPLRWMALEYMTQGYHDTKSDVVSHVKKLMKLAWHYLQIEMPVIFDSFYPISDIRAGKEKEEKNKKGRERIRKLVGFPCLFVFVH